jgi:hypothetical protein
VRGRLIFPFLVGIARLDRDATRAADGYNDTLRSVTTDRPQGARGPREKLRQELPEVRVKCQVEEAVVNAQRQGPGGNVPETRVTYVAHFKDLEIAGLVDADSGKPLVGPNDRITALYTRHGVLERTFERPQVFITEARGGSYSLGHRRNLLFLISSERPQGLEAAV